MAAFTPWDYLLFVLLLIVSTGIGIYFGFSDTMQRTKKGYLLANHSMSAWPVAFSIVATFGTASNLLGIPQESYQFGISFAYITTAYVIGAPLIIYLFLPVFYRMRITSVYEYLERRFGYTTRLLASLSFSLQIVLLNAIGFYGPAMALVTVTGIDRITAIVVMGLVCTFYSTVGGMKAVLMADVFQCVLMFAGIYSVIVSSVLKGHGIGEIWETSAESGRLSGPSLSLDPTIRSGFWALTVGGLGIYLSGHTNQMCVQRLMSVKSLKCAQQAMWWSMLLKCFMLISITLGGLVIFNFYKDCDPVLEGRIVGREQLLTLYVIDTMVQYPGLAGLFASGVFSASLSTVSSTLNALSAITIDDYIGPFCEKVLGKPLQSQSSLLPKAVACFYGILSTFLAMLHIDNTEGLAEIQFVIVGAASGSALGLFFLGMFTVKTNQLGAVIGSVVGFATASWIALGKPKPLPDILPLSVVGCQGYNVTSVVDVSPPEVVEYFYLFKISYLWLSVIGFAMTSVSGYTCSFILEKLNLASNDKIFLDNAKTQIDFNLFAPPFSRSWRRNATVRVAFTKEYKSTPDL